MRIYYNSLLDARRFAAEAVGNQVRIGRGSSNDIVLDNPQVSDEAVVLFRRNSRWELLSVGMNGCQVGDQEVPCGSRLAIDHDVEIRLFPYVLQICLPASTNADEPSRRSELDDRMSQFMAAVHLDLLARMDTSIGVNTTTVDDDQLFSLERFVEEIAHLRGLTQPENEDLAAYMAGQSVRAELLSAVLEHITGRGVALLERESNWSRLMTAVPNNEDDLRATVSHLARLLQLDSASTTGAKLDLVDHHFDIHWTQVSHNLFKPFHLYLALRHLKKQIKDVVFGYGPLEDLLRVPTVSEIMVVDRDHIYIEKNGVLENSGRRFLSDAVTETIIARIVAKVQRRIDRARPLVDARLTDGSRVNAVIPPIAVSGPCLTIRKFPLRRLRIDDLLASKSISPQAVDFLRAAVLVKKNILISGGTGTGKTTLLNCLSDFIPDKERVVTIEDTAELQLLKEHVVRLETKQENIEGTGAYTIRDLVKNALRMRPDRVIVGECRGAEALDMLQAMNTGHDGSMTTIHANTAADVVQRLDVLVQMASQHLPVAAIRQQIVSAIDVIVQLSRLRDGRRVVTQISEVLDIDDESGSIRLKDLYRGSWNGESYTLEPTGSLPTFIASMIDTGLFSLDAIYV
jgi:pilus assembly protein CpaF